MAVIKQASMDFIATADTPLFFSPYTSGTPVIATGGSVDKYLDPHSSGQVSLIFDNATRTFLWFHCRFRWVSGGYSPEFNFFSPTGVGQCALYADSAGVFHFGRRTFNVGWYYAALNGYFTDLAQAAPADAIKNNVWYSLEGELLLHSSTGSFGLWLNGKKIIDLTNANTVNTTYAGDYLYGMSLDNPHVDDWMIGDNTGANTGHPGELRIDCMMPNANGTDRATGGSGEMTRSNTGVDECTLLDETASSAGTGDYIYADAVGEKCSLNVAALTNTGGTIVAVQCTVYASKNEAGPCGFKIYCLRGGTRYYSDEFFPSFGSWAYFYKVWDQDPSTSAAWTESNFNAAEFGVERTT